MKNRKSLALSLVLLAGCVAPKETQVESNPTYFSGTIEELMKQIGAEPVTDEELMNCRAPMFPPEGYQDPQKRMLYWSLLRNTNRIPRISSYK